MEVDNAEVRETIPAGGRGESFGGWRSLMRKMRRWMTVWSMEKMDPIIFMTWTGNSRENSFAYMKPVSNLTESEDEK